MAETDHASNGIESKDDTAEQHKLSLMRVFVESRDPSSKEVDDLMLRRFLRARDLNVEKAGAMFLKYLKWRKTFLPKGCVTKEEIQYDLSHNKIHLGGVDKKGRPIVVAFAGRHYQNSKSGGLDEFKRLVVYTLDTLCARMPAGQEKFLAIGDLQGWGYSNSDIRGYLGALSILQDCYPERLGKLCIVHAPKIFMAVWKVIYPFIDDNTKTKIEFVEKKQMKSTMLEDIEESQLPDIYGGKLPIVPIQDA
ncbi:random slug protein 5-like [Chenopodium quinoa]|uniref:CRAL-TRIO domain-containing protein n=1 Tax=Chenopodium quinoa TaxID=63459 RepID=A0A803NB84_CHEQI|nr:random slug protein 5-like [Chenopodium quinoa]